MLRAPRYMRYAHAFVKVMLRTIIGLPPNAAALRVARLRFADVLIRRPDAYRSDARFTRLPHRASRVYASLITLRTFACVVYARKRRRHGGECDGAAARDMRAALLCLF